MKRALRSQALCGLALLASVATGAFGGSYSVDPVRVFLSERTPLASISVRNTGVEATVVQVETSAWSQSAGRMILAPTSEVLATPPIFTIPPAGTQLVRLGLRRAADSQRELAYRVVLHEVLAQDPTASGLRVALDISLPVFVKPPVPSAPKLQWHLLRGENGELRLEVANTGNAHVRLATVELADAETGKRFARQDLSAYLLPADGRGWTLGSAPLPSTAPVIVHADTDAGGLESRVQLENDVALPDARAPQTIPTPR